MTDPPGGIMQDPRRVHSPPCPLVPVVGGGVVEVTPHEEPRGVEVGGERVVGVLTDVLVVMEVVVLQRQ